VKNKLQTNICIAATLIIILFIGVYDASAQRSRLMTNDQSAFVKAISSNWSVAIDAGASSYYGDMSQFDFDYIYKLQNETGLGNSITLSNKFMPFLSLQAKMIWGRFRSEYEGNNRRLEGSTTQMTLALAVDFVSLFSYPNKMSQDIPIYPYAILGYGMCMINSKLYNLENGRRILTTSYQRDGVNETALTFGLGLNMFLAGDLDFTAEFYYNRLHSDKLDVRVSNNPNDYYVYLGFGLKYNINSSSGGSSRYKRKGNYRQRNYRR